LTHRSTSPSAKAQCSLQYDYTTVGHVTVDVLSDGTRRPGGSALYSALQAARLGARTLVITQGLAAEIEELLEPHRGELDVEILPAAATTTFETRGSGATRSQRLLAWAGAIEGEVSVETSILHLAPVARETPRRFSGRAPFIGLTPQGLARRWEGEGGPVTLSASTPRALFPERWDALVVSEQERSSCAEMISETLAGGGVAAITAGAEPTTILLADGSQLEARVAIGPVPGEDLGAGDVFAAAFFIALADGRNPGDAAAFANAASAVRLTGIGAGAIGGREAIEARLQAAGR
jgi:pfkB family carbohydrate kinase